MFSRGFCPGPARLTFDLARIASGLNRPTPPGKARKRKTDFAASIDIFLKESMHGARCAPFARGSSESFLGVACSAVLGTRRWHAAYVLPHAVVFHFFPFPWHRFFHSNLVQGLPRSQKCGNSRSTIRSGGRFKKVALQRFLPPPIGFEISAQAGLTGSGRHFLLISKFQT